jgi:hypothetical protein
MNTPIVQAALENYLSNPELSDFEREEIEFQLNQLNENHSSFWKNYLSDDESSTYYYSEILDNQGEGFYDSLPQF